MDISRSALDKFRQYVEDAEKYPNLELEVRFSTFFTQLYRRDQIADNNKPSNYTFVPLIERQTFYNVLNYLLNRGWQSTCTETVEWQYPDFVRQVTPITPEGSTYYFEKKRKCYPFDIFQYGIRLCLSEENMLSCAPQGSHPKLQRQKTRTSIWDPNYPMVRFDLTRVMTDKLNGILPLEGYEIEIEWIPCMGGTYQQLVNAVTLMLQIMSGTPWIITIPEKHNTMYEYYNMIGRHDYFVGAQPETLQRYHLEKMRQIRYSITDKLDGERAFFIVRGDGKCFVLNRKTEIRGTGLTCTSMGKSILDVEVINNGSSEVYHVFDALIYQGNDLRGNTKMNLKERLKLAKKVIENTSDQERIRLKIFVWSVVDIDKLNDDSLQQSNLVKDGYIFTPVDEPYPQRARWEALLKWKPPEANSIDFILDLKSEHPTVKVTLKDNTSAPFEPCSRVLIPNGMQVWDQCIVECVYDKDTWRVMRVRQDKKKANYFKVAHNVWQAINNPVTWDDIYKTMTYTTQVNQNSQLRLTHMATKSTCAQPSGFDRLRASHNKIKATLIDEASELARQSFPESNLRVLDIGCGRGGDLFKWDAQQHVTEYVGVDKNDELLLEAKERSQKVKRIRTKFVQCDLTCEFPSLGNEKFDIISCQFCFHYFFGSKGVFDNVMNIMDHYLKKDGILIVTTLDGHAVYSMCKDGSPVCVRKKNKAFTITPTSNFKVGMDIVRKHCFGMGINVKLEGDDTLILNKYQEQEYLVFADTFVHMLSEHDYLLIKTNMFNVDKTDMSNVESKFSSLHRLFLLKKMGDDNSIVKPNIEKVIMTPTLQIELGGAQNVYRIMLDKPVHELMTIFTGVTVNGNSLQDIVDSNVNVVIGKWSPNMTECTYVVPHNFFDDAIVVHFDAFNKILVNQDRNTKHLHATWTPSEKLLQQQRATTSISATSSIDTTSETLNQTTSVSSTQSDNMVFLGRKIEGRSKDTWTIKELRDLAASLKIDLAKNLKKKTDIAMFLHNHMQSTDVRTKV